MSVVIKTENVSKLYRLGAVGASTLRDDAHRLWARLRGLEDPTILMAETNDRTQKGISDYVWALRNINFEVTKGEVLGIIGKNGAGKSTLLKILSKVTAPTTGSIKVKGRIASLLEVGTGFHPELTGKENIYLNGHILGMTRLEIDRKFDEIVDFAGVEKYLDTPVKRYSSGMYVRLAFAVAAHLEPEILIVDEVLAVGDAEFQKKCLGKMNDVSKKDGRTILFVSHNMAAVQTLCTRAIVLDQGTIKYEGNVEKAVHQNLITGGTLINHKILKPGEITGNGCAVIECGIKAKGKSYEEPMRMDEELFFTIQLLNENKNRRIDVTLQFKGENGDVLFVVSSGDCDIVNFENKFTCNIPSHFFNEGDFFINLLVVENRTRVIIRENDILSFSIQPKAKASGKWLGKTAGSLRPVFNWEAT